MSPITDFGEDNSNLAWYGPRDNRSMSAVTRRRPACGLETTAAVEPLRRPTLNPKQLIPGTAFNFRYELAH